MRGVVVPEGVPVLLLVGLGVVWFVSMDKPKG